MKTNFDHKIDRHRIRYNPERMFFKNKMLKKLRKIRIVAFLIFTTCIFIPCTIFLAVTKNLLFLIPFLLLPVFITILDWWFINPYGTKTFYKRAEKESIVLKSWINDDVISERVKKMSSDYNFNELGVLKDIAKEKLGVNKGLNFKKIELILIPLLTIIIVDFLGINFIYEYVSYKWYNNTKLSIEQKINVLKLTTGLILSIIILYHYTKWTLEMSKRNRTKEIQDFIDDINDIVIFKKINSYEENQRNT